MQEYFDMKMKTKHGVDKVQIMLKFITVIESQGTKIKTNFDRFKSFICQQIQRGITPEEEKSLLEGIVKWQKHHIWISKIIDNVISK